MMNSEDIGMTQQHKVSFFSFFNQNLVKIPCFQKQCKCCEFFATITSPFTKKKNTISTVGSGKISNMRKNSDEVDDSALEQSIASFKNDDGCMFKGIVAAVPEEPRACGCVSPPPIVEMWLPIRVLRVSQFRGLLPKAEYTIGLEGLIKTKTPPMKASELWREKPAILLCIRRPGCIMCRAEAHQLYSKKPIFDALGIQLYVVLQEHIETEAHFRLRDEFFKALGGGKHLKDKFISDFLLNPRAIANYKRAKTIGVDQNFKGEGEIKDGLFIFERGKNGIAHQFIERNSGDWAPLAEVIDICTRIQNPLVSRPEATQSIKGIEE